MTAIRDAIEEMIRAAGGRIAIVRKTAGRRGGEYDNREIGIELLGRGGGDASARIPNNSAMDLDEGDRIIVAPVDGQLAVIGFQHTENGRLYPQLRTDQISSPSQSFTLASGDSSLTLSDGALPGASLTVNGSTVDLTNTGNTVKVSSNDTTADNLINKLAAGTGIAITELNNGGNEDAQIAITTVPVANGGTGQTSANPALNALAPTTTKGDLIAHNGTVNARLAAGTSYKLLMADSGATEGVSYQYGAVRQFAQTADVTVANTAVETTLVGTGQGSATLAINRLEVGTVVRVHARGFLSTKAASAGTLEIQAKFGSTQVCTTGAVTVTDNLSNVYFETILEITCRSTGGSGTVVAGGAAGVHGSRYGMVKTTTTTIDTTTTQAVNVTATWGTADAGNTVTAQQVIIEVVG